METYHTIMNILLSAALFVNALLFLPQAYRIIKDQTIAGLSLATFLGFLIIQLIVVLHGILIHDYILIGGYLISMLTCGIVVALIFIYRYSDHGTRLDANEILNQLPGHIYWKDEHGIFLGSNQNNMEDFGFKHINDFIGKTDYDLFDKDEADMLRIVDEEVFRENKIKLFEEYLTNCNGSKSIYLSCKKPLYHNKTRIGILGYSIDITDIKNKHDNHVSMLENILAIMPGHVYWMDRNGRYLGCNHNQAKSAGLSSRKDIVGKRNIDLPWNATDSMPPEEVDKVNERVMSEGKPVNEEEIAIVGDQTFTFISKKTPLFDHKNNIIGLVGVSIDITERKKQEMLLLKAKEDAEQAVLIKNEFIKNIEHDLRTPFSGMLGISEMLWMQEDDPTKKQALGEVVRGAKQLLDYHNSILDFSKVASGSMPVTGRKVHLDQLIEHVISIEQPAATMNHIQLTVEYDNTIPKTIIADQYRIKSILLNLVSNAIKFTHQGSVILKASLYSYENQKAIIRFHIKDTGIGIEQSKQDYIFEQFSRLSLSNKGLYQGIGLGLKIVKEFVDDLGGDIDIISEPGKGTEFIISLPFNIPLTADILSN